MQRSAYRGQSLIEFILILPILILVLVGGATIGMGAYQSHMASDAIRQPGMLKMAFSKTRDPIPDATLLNAINQSSLKGNLQTGAYLDELQLIDNDTYSTLLIGTKRFNGGLPVLPTYTVKVGQVVNKNLLQAANNGAAEVRPYGTPWVPFGAPAKPPWEP